MTIISKNRGKYVKRGSFEAVKICDRSGFYFSESDICKEMEWRGNELVPTGFLVGRPYLNTPNEQNRTPKVSNDPKPVVMARPLNGADQDDGPDAPPEPVAKAQLDNFNYSAPLPYSYDLPNGATNPPLGNIGGPDVSGINATQRLRMLHSIEM